MVVGALIQSMGNDIKAKQYMAEFEAEARAPTIFDFWRSASLGINLVTGISLIRLAGEADLNREIILSGLENVAVTTTYHNKIIHSDEECTYAGDVTEDIERNYYQAAEALDEVYNAPVSETTGGGRELTASGRINTKVKGKFATTAVKLFLRQSYIGNSLFVGPRTMMVYGTDGRTAMFRFKLHIVAHTLAYQYACLTNGAFHLEHYAYVGVVVGTRIEKIRMVLRNVGQVVKGEEMQIVNPLYDVIQAAMPAGTPPIPDYEDPKEALATYLEQNGFAEEGGPTETTT